MAPLMSTNAELFKIAGDLFFRNLDFPGADTIADRLAAMNPLANVDSKSDIPPEAQMQIAASQEQIKQLQDQLTAAQLEINNRLQVAQLREEGATKRKLMDVTARAHNTETISESRMHESNIRAVTSQNEAEIRAMAQLLVKRMDTDQLQAEIARRNNEQLQMMQVGDYQIEEGANPFLTR
jgi:hypothetical protein